MSAKTEIAWADRTWNPVRGCSLVSAGCANCDAMKFAHRFSGKGKPYEGLTELGPQGPRWNGKIRLVHEALEQPLHWKKPQRVLVNSMSDLFHEDVPFSFIDSVFGIMGAEETGHHTFQILTKRPKRMLEYMQRFQRHQIDAASFLPQVWLGVSVEDQATADERIQILLQTPAAIRFVSYEPALGVLTLSRWLKDFWQIYGDLFDEAHGELDCDEADSGAVLRTYEAAKRRANNGLHWVIVGGESGPGARPMHPQWARNIRDQCQAAGVPFFFKQWGEWLPNEQAKKIVGCHGRHGQMTLGEHTIVMERIGKKKAGALLDGKEWREFPC